MVAGEALDYFGKLYGVEREVIEFDVDERRRIREVKARPIADELHAWLTRQRQMVPNGNCLSRYSIQNKSIRTSRVLLSTPSLGIFG
ncbi:IS66 family transposase [Ferribacterium limneticum]|uniref:IS66 family transposase n=1 Tax=Ferribacterium limneticum TaxID=76259 RepID=UPI001CFA1E07|nr:transposase [Ferribacterium limneticum]